MQGEVPSHIFNRGSTTTGGLKNGNGNAEIHLSKDFVFFNTAIIFSIIFYFI
jgi:hypothetical protein